MMRTIIATNELVPDTLPLKNFPIYQSDDLEEVEAHACGAFGDHRILIEGKDPHLRFRHNRINLLNLSFNAIDYGQLYKRIVLDIVPISKTYMLLCPLKGSGKLLVDGTEFTLKPSMAYLLKPEDEARQVFNSGYQHLAIIFRKEDIETIYTQDFNINPCNVLFHIPNSGHVGESICLSNLIKTVAQTIAVDREIYTDARCCIGVEEAIKHLLAGTFPPNRVDKRSTLSLTIPHYITRAEKFIRANINNFGINLEEIASAAGVSVRSLHVGFRRFRNTTPMRYLKKERLRLARQRLMQTDNQNINVTAVALACGFSHLSQFAQDYKAYFGELPSVTLRTHR